MDLDKDSQKLPSYYAIIFISFWVILYMALVIPFHTQLPRALYVKDEIRRSESFIAERAQKTVKSLTDIGPRVVGSRANEVTTIEWLKRQIGYIKAQSSSYFHWEVDVQVVSGNFSLQDTLYIYQAVQNVVVKLSAWQCNSENYLLINSHFDTVPQSPGAGDDGSMVAVMLEVMRVITSSGELMKNPIVFLFNGAEEAGMLGAHGFITQHKWAKSCKAVINLDAAGSGGRVILFQSGPNHPWLLDYYRQVPYPFATSLGEELFQGGLIPSDTDFHIFREFGSMPGLDMASISNGYIYHTNFDDYEHISNASLQNAGENLLKLVRVIANAPELQNTTQFERGPSVFYDFLGYFLILYSRCFGVLLNLVVCLIALIAIFISMHEITVRFAMRWSSLMGYFGVMFTVQLFGMVVGASAAMLVALFLNNSGYALSWFSQKWLIMGLYFCPIFFGMTVIPATFLKNIENLRIDLNASMLLFLNAHCVFLIIFTIIFTALGVRSAFMGMIAILFYVFGLIININNNSQGKDREFWFAMPILLSQIIPFMFYASTAHTIYEVIVPTTARIGNEINPEILVAVIGILMAIFLAGFLLPLLLAFRKTTAIAFSFLIITVVTLMLATTPLGFPFRNKAAVQRFGVAHSHRIVHNIDQSIKSEEHGIRVQVLDGTIIDLNGFRKLFKKNQAFIKRYGKRSVRYYQANKTLNFWIPSLQKPLMPTAYPKFRLLEVAKTRNLPNIKSFRFSLSGPNFMNIFLNLNHARIVDWSLVKPLNSATLDFPLNFRVVSGKYSYPINFSITLERLDDNNESQTHTLEVGVSGYWFGERKFYVNDYRQFIWGFPNYAFVDDSLISHEKWLFKV